MDEHERHVSIIGGGIGGLAAASALQRAGMRVTVFERNHELREVGAGLTLWANGVQVLQQLGLASEIAAASAPLTHFECWSWRGKRLGSMPLDSIEKAMGAANIGIHRADLLRLLAGTLVPGTVQLDAHCVGFTQEEGGVTSHFADGQHHHADVLVGADGLLQELFHDWRPPIEQLIEATDEAAILRNDIFDRKPVRHWGSERVTLLGDAAHPPTPNLGQGACQALEDALILARRLGSTRKSVVALRAYEASRMKRSAAIIEQSYRFGRIGQWEHPLLCSLRDALTPLAFATVLPWQFAANVRGSSVGEARGGAGVDPRRPAAY
jgi:2-polyprenyl-6-methoxyphenol hydroxylase-like FAD-dependent oxidoreductase